MPHLNHTGPEGKGSKTGRKLGNCTKGDNEPISELGKGMGKKRKSGGGTGQGKRLKSSKIFNNK